MNARAKARKRASERAREQAVADTETETKNESYLFLQLLLELLETVRFAGDIVGFSISSVEDTMEKSFAITGNYRLL